MLKEFIINNMEVALREKEHPSITLWNRLEGRPRAKNFDRALKAEIRDPLWMLTKQWQMGEFKGDDAGSPVFAKVQYHTTRLNKYKANDRDVQLYEENIPLEAKVEQRPVPFKKAGQKISLDIRLLMGRQWLKMVEDVGDFKKKFIGLYPIEMPAGGVDESVYVMAHPGVHQQYAAVAGNCMDGYELYFFAKDNPAGHVYQDIAVTAAQGVKIDELAGDFVKWFERLFYQPVDPVNNAWQPSRLEYKFACSAPGEDGPSGEKREKILDAEEYYHGRLDWYSVDMDREKENAGLGDIAGVTLPDSRETVTRSFMPGPLVFDGMPNTRWWCFEDRKTNFGDIHPGTMEVAKLLLIEFGLVYANDWFVFPFTVPAGTITQIKGMAVTNVFGERTWIDPSGSGDEENWRRWNMYTLNIKETGNPAGTGQKADMSMVLLPTVPKIQEGNPLDEAVFTRDEMANMVWGVETMVPLASGASKPGKEAAAETMDFYKKLLEKKLAGVPSAPPSPGTGAAIRYEVMSGVPEHYIPFIPVHIGTDNRDTQLQRAAMPRILEGETDPPGLVRPQTILLREGLDKAAPESYFIFEEEIPRAGIRVSQSFQRTRWTNGKVFLWLGARKKTGRGESSSGLAFDRILPVEQQ